MAGYLIHLKVLKQSLFDHSLICDEICGNYRPWDGI